MTSAGSQNRSRKVNVRGKDFDGVDLVLLYRVGLAMTARDQCDFMCS